MEEINLKELFSYIKSKFSIVIIIVSLCCVLGSVYGLYLQKPMYSSYTTVILSGNQDLDKTSITQTDIYLNQNLVDTYTEVVKSKTVLNQVIENLDIDYDYNELTKLISVSSVNDTEIIKISVINQDAEVASDIANVCAKYFISKVTELYNLNNVNILDIAYIDYKPYNINVLKQTLLYFAIGLAISLGGLFLLFYFDRTIKTVEEIEEKIKFPLLGSIHIINKGGKKNGK